MMNEHQLPVRPGTERAPWRDPYGWSEQRQALLSQDPNDNWKNYKQSSITVPGDLGMPDLTFNLTTVRTDMNGRGVFTLFLEWIDELGRPNRIRVPGEVFRRAVKAAETLTSENRSRVSAEAAERRKARSLEA